MTPESVCGSDISKTDSEVDDCNGDDDSWLEFKGLDGFVNGVTGEGIDGLSEISFCTAKYKKNLSTMDIVQHHDTSDTESETDNNKDHDDKQLVV